MRRRTVGFAGLRGAKRWLGGVAVVALCALCLGCAQRETTLGSVAGSWQLLDPDGNPIGGMILTLSDDMTFQEPGLPALSGTYTFVDGLVKMRVERMGELTRESFAEMSGDMQGNTNEYLDTLDKQYVFDLEKDDAGEYLLRQHDPNVGQAERVYVRIDEADD
ncbi:MAG: hypothetical protein IH944_01715 [Armatimonadetes bacterium]|nr:hypothetical protein [Armatimonadota bacterium]